MKVGDLENNLFKTVYACISLDGYTSRSLEIIRVVDPPLGLRGSGVGAQAWSPVWSSACSHPGLSGSKRPLPRHPRTGSEEPAPSTGSLLSLPSVATCPVHSPALRGVGLSPGRCPCQWMHISPFAVPLTQGSVCYLLWSFIHTWMLQWGPQGTAWKVVWRGEKGQVLRVWAFLSPLSLCFWV